MQKQKRRLLLGAGAAAACGLFPAAKLFAAPFLTPIDIDPALIAEPPPVNFTGTRVPVNFTGTLVPVSQFGIWPQQADDTSIADDYYTKMKTAIAYATANRIRACRMVSTRRISSRGCSIPMAGRPTRYR